jgi:uncharacterized protein (DUF849 family)
VALVNILMIVQACLNGGHPGSYHPAIPTNIQALVADGRKVLSVGASELHLHVRGEGGLETLAPDTVDATIKALREDLPGTLIGISTGAWIEKDDDRVLAYIGRWSVPPDYASVNLGEKNAPAVFERLHRHGIGIEAGLGDKQDAERLVTLGLDRLSLRILIEVGEQDIERAHAVTDEILGVLRSAPFHRPFLLHGDNACAWPLLRRAVESGFSTRIGLEDVSVLPDGSVTPSNTELVAAAAQIVHQVSPFRR